MADNDAENQQLPRKTPTLCFGFYAPKGTEMFTLCLHKSGQQWRLFVKSEVLKV